VYHHKTHAPAQLALVNKNQLAIFATMLGNFYLSCYPLFCQNNMHHTSLVSSIYASNAESCNLFQQLISSSTCHNI